jgi:ergosteryl-3beta-O-L-aspartate synthase
MSGNPLRKLSKIVHPSNGHHERKGSGSGEIAPHQSHSSHQSQSPGPHRRSLAQILHLERDYGSSSDNESETDGVDSDGMSKNQQRRLATKQKKKEAKSRLSLEHRDDSEERSKKRLEDAAKVETDAMRARYGDLPLMQSTTRNTSTRIQLDTITEAQIGQEVTFRARLHHVRNMGVKLVFLIFRQQLATIQGVMVEKPGEIGPLMMHWAEHLRTGSIVLVTGTLKKPEIPVRSASIHTIEVHVSKLKVIVKRAEPGTWADLLKLYSTDFSQCPSLFKKLR